jgi:uncharacterized protein (DUF362 family)
MSIVSISSSAQSYSGTTKALEPLQSQLKKRLNKLDQLVVKINFVTARNKLATTPVESVHAFIDFIQPFYKGKIIIAEEASIGSTKTGFKQFGYQELAENYPQVELVYSKNTDSKKVTLNYPQGAVTVPLSKLYLNNFVVSITRPKTHDAVVVTLSIKNLLVGAIQGGIPIRQQIHQGHYINWILKQLSKHIYPDLAVIDGTIGMQGQGPGSGDPIESNWSLASFDPLAADSLATALMGFKIKNVGYLNLIKKTGKGKLYPEDKIKIIGPDPEQLKKHYQPHSSFEQQKNWQR